MERNGLNRFEGIAFINLAYRKDRRDSIEGELSRLGILPSKKVRIDAICDELNGTRGCVRSHICALEYALSRNWNNVLVLEDDCVFNGDRRLIDAYVDHFFEHFKQAWDVFFLGTNIREQEITEHPDFLRVRFSTRAHAYAVNGPYIKKLIEHYLRTLDSMEGDLFFTSSMKKALDRSWIALQKEDRWYGGGNMLAHQMESFSDIEKEIKTFR